LADIVANSIIVPTGPSRLIPASGMHVVHWTWI